MRRFEALNMFSGVASCIGDELEGGPAVSARPNSDLAGLAVDEIHDLHLLFTLLKILLIDTQGVDPDVPPTFDVIVATLMIE